MNMDDKLFNYYLELKSPEAGEWNSSPECIHTELITRDYVRREFPVTDGIKVCNVGIGTGDWDDYLGYWLKGKGNLTSIDINKDICEIFAYRQQREGHPNPSKVLCKSIFDKEITNEKYDIVTLIGSAIKETGDFERCLDSCFDLLNTGGFLMFMANLKYSLLERLEEYLTTTNFQLEQKNLYEVYSEYAFFICKIKK
ncbi:class I SAM-dependent methyltransferase [Paenibacillus polygoni]|uniref:Class I SAM-dependent methyltransferase n=1 Tax=Paenibacillus polygoni TaxID=3050112 RepID=A0ABY8WZV0_9BACL|nr:class I SAM-dependent methyltransferase [Paenibacillus polygoni]WIV17259.1 class I SAM-dependent methyltransferase [Paenibacillus polygoni]